MSFQIKAKRFFGCLALFVGALVFCLAPVNTYAQVVGATLTGTVSDPSGAVIPNASVAVKNVATGVVVSVVTNSAGLYSVPNLIPGTYAVTTSAKGFETQTQTGITLTVGATQTFNITLPVGQSTQKVTVSAAPPLVQLASSTVSATVNSTTMRELPLNGRDWTSLAVLQ
ncbi:MAG: carboxypeptidase-like regulatory domain-containing protein, partial [Terriglobia bacterium]